MNFNPGSYKSDNSESYISDYISCQLEFYVQEDSKKDISKCHNSIAILLIFRLWKELKIIDCQIRIGY